MLGVRAHSPACHDDDDPRNQISSWPTMPRPREPNTKKAGTPPDYAHGRMLEIISNPRATPSVFRECVDAAPCRNEQRVEKFLTSACFPQPELPNQKNYCHHDSVADERSAHDEVCQTLTEVISSTVAHCRDATKYHLYPRHNGHEFTDPAVCCDKNFPHIAQPS